MTFEEWQAGDMTKLSESIYKYRTMKILTQPQFAKLCGVSYSTIQKIEKRKQKVEYAVIKKIIDVLEAE